MFAKTPTYIKLPQSLEAKVAFIAVLHDLHPFLRWGMECHWALTATEICSKGGAYLMCG